MNNSKQHGATLIEILVSAFILSLGVLALTSMQVKSTSSIMEARMNMRISQEAFRLGQNILTNPDFTNNKRNYKPYDGKTCTPIPADVDKTILSKNEMVTKHLHSFCSAVKTLNQNENRQVKILVCENDSFITGDNAFKYDGELKCGTSGTQTILKVSWALDDASFENTYQLILPHE